MYTSDKRLCLDASGEKVVDCDSAEAAELLVGEGGQLPMAKARKYGLVQDEADVKADVKAQDAPPANKAKKAAPENKGG